MAVANAQVVLISGGRVLSGGTTLEREAVLEVNGAVVLRAEEVDFVSGGTRVVASGNVVFISDGGCVTADRAEFEVARETGQFLGAGTFHNARVSGSEGCADR